MTRVVQIEPGPIPTLTTSAPSLIKSSAALAVAIPTTTSIRMIFFYFFKHLRHF